MNRKQRRAIAKLGLPQGLAQTRENLESALGALQGFEGLGPQMDEALTLVRETHMTVSALVDDVQELADEIALLKAVLFQEPAMKERFEALRASASSSEGEAPCTSLES